VLFLNKHLVKYHLNIKLIDMFIYKGTFSVRCAAGVIRFFLVFYARKLQKLRHTEFRFYCNFIGYVVRTLLSATGSYMIVV